MSELVVLPEMLLSGIEALRECRARELGDDDTVISVYLAMQAIWEISEMKRPNESIH